MNVNLAQAPNRSNGRPPSSYAYPRIWEHLREMKEFPNERGLIRLKQKAPAFFSVISNRTITNNCRPENPVLLELSTARTLVMLVNVHRRELRLEELNPANELYRFNGKILGVSFFHSKSSSEKDDICDNIGISAGYSAFVISNAFNGRLLPGVVCDKIVKAASSVGFSGLSFDEIVVRRGETPLSDSTLLKGVLKSLI